VYSAGSNRYWIEEDDGDDPMGRGGAMMMMMMMLRDHRLLSIVGARIQILVFSRFWGSLRWRLALVGIGSSPVHCIVRRTYRNLDFAGFARLFCRIVTQH
jgi:hypothetical protein